MRIVLQRVSSASVEINGSEKASIGTGLLVLLGIEENDDESDIEWLVKKVINMRIFPDEQGTMNRSLIDTRGDLVVVSQFTLMASTKKGNRPSYIRAAQPSIAIPLYQQFIQSCENQLGKNVQSGEFGAHMNIGLTNDGPVTILLDSRSRE